MADRILYKIHGSDLQMVEVALNPGHGVIAEAGAMAFMDGTIEMQTKVIGGVVGGLKRKVTGESFFMTSFTNEGNELAKVGFAAPYPGKIIALDLEKYGGMVYCQKGGFLCAARGTEVSLAFTKKIGAGLFGGEGFILQKIESDGLAFIHAGGTIIEKVLAPGQELKVDTGCLVAFTQGVRYDISFVGGVRNALFGKEGLFLASLRGPGKVFIQSLPVPRLADALRTSRRLKIDEQTSSRSTRR